MEAIEKCKEAGTTLVIVKIGRFVRNAKFLSLLLDRAWISCVSTMSTATRIRSAF